MSAYVMDMPGVEGSTAPLDLVGAEFPFKHARNVPAFNVPPGFGKKFQSAFFGTMPTEGVFGGEVSGSHKRSAVASIQGIELLIWPGIVGTTIGAVGTSALPIELDPADTWPVGITVEAVRIRDRATEARFKFAFQKARDEYFEDGMESQFTLDLRNLVTMFGMDSKNILSRMFDEGSDSPEVWAEAMRWLGVESGPLSRSDVIDLLKKGLNSPSSEVRDGAILGFAGLDAPESIPALQQALLREPASGLQADIEQVLQQLKSR
jgi:hypothetical protein